MAAGTCRRCGCTDNDCRQCIERTGVPCSWVEPDLCSACKTDEDREREFYKGGARLPGFRMGPYGPELPPPNVLVMLPPRSRKRW